MDCRPDEDIGAARVDPRLSADTIPDAIKAMSVDIRCPRDGMRARAARSCGQGRWVDLTGRFFRRIGLRFTVTVGLLLIAAGRVSLRLLGRPEGRHRA